MLADPKTLNNLNLLIAFMKISEFRTQNKNFPLLNSPSKTLINYTTIVTEGKGKKDEEETNIIKYLATKDRSTFPLLRACGAKV